MASLRDKILATIRGHSEPDASDTTIEPSEAATQPGAASSAQGETTMQENDRALLAACREAGLTTPDQVKTAKADAAYRTKYVDRLKGEAKRVATIATGRDMSATVETMNDPVALEAFIADMGTSADKQFRTTPTQPAQRTTTAPDPAAGAGNPDEERSGGNPPAVNLDPQDVYARRRQPAASNGKGGN